ncbi:DUF868 family protein (DUF868) [Rhynchospora pubera]|uniref:DUF868 family protein (DUF868) n=1 Tax=Rhynchospora pubera TaxID=906938 RepID=A0AAV8DGS9_9POAL|nr:DUF868 family protein (DUF868) [Rhynchospora pubera]
MHLKPNTMHEQPPVLPCFVDPASTMGAAMAAPKPGQRIVMSVYRTKIAGHCRLITISWYRDLLSHGFSVSIDKSGDSCPDNGSSIGKCKVELRPWHFWRKHGSKLMYVDERPVHVHWDLRNAKFSGDPEPRSGYYIAVVSDEVEEAVLMLGDLKKDGYKRTASRPASIDATLVSRKEHIYGKKRFTMRSKLHERGRHHEIIIQFSDRNSGSSVGGNIDPEMEIKIDGHIVISVKHLQWKFRGNQSITVGKARIEVYWDVHDWLFSPGLSHALFIFKPVMLMSSSTSASSSLSSLLSTSEGSGATVSDTLPGFCLYLHAWKLE